MIALVALAVATGPSAAAAQDDAGAPPAEAPADDEPQEPSTVPAESPDAEPAAPETEPKAPTAEPDAPADDPEAPAVEPALPMSGQVRYGAVDAATVRVFAVGPVEVDRFEVERRTITFAITNAGHGTGFAVGSGRLIATARHVVEGAIHVVVRRPGDSGFSVARVVYESGDADVAILAIEESIAPLQLADDATALRVRATAFAVGYPLDPTRKFAQSAQGIIAGNLEDGTVQIDMDVNPGNSGGPLLDGDDRVIGMVVARARMSAGAQGIGFAVPIKKVAEAVRQAEATLAAGGIPAPSAAQRKSATVVDELVQSGALKSLHDASDLEGGLRGENLERGLDSISAGVDDPDLLAFISGNLWNASLVLRYGGIQQIGDNEISKAEARSLANRFEREAVELSKIAYRRDPAVIDRSPFVDFARRRRAYDDSNYERAPPGDRTAATASQRRLTVRAWAGFNIRLNPDTGTTGLGATAGGYIELIRKRPERIVRVIPVLGTAVGTVSLDAEMGDDSFRHTYVSAELGAVVRASKYIEVGGVYAPGLYWSSVRDSTDQASALIFGHARLWGSAVFGNFTVSTSVRALSGPTFWLEPITIGFIY